MTEHTILCEPQCWGFEHAPFNAALLDTVLLAYPDSPVLFAGEREHVERVRQALGKYDAKSLQRVEWQVISIPPRHLGGRHRLAEEWGQFRHCTRESFCLKLGANL